MAISSEVLTRFSDSATGWAIANEKFSDLKSSLLADWKELAPLAMAGTRYTKPIDDERPIPAARAKAIAAAKAELMDAYIAADPIAAEETDGMKWKDYLKACKSKPKGRAKYVKQLLDKAFSLAGFAERNRAAQGLTAEKLATMVEKAELGPEILVEAAILVAQNCGVDISDLIAGDAIEAVEHLVAA